MFGIKRPKELSIGEEEKQLLEEWLANLFCQLVYRNSKANAHDITEKICSDCLLPGDSIDVTLETSATVRLTTKELGNVIKDLKEGKTPKFPTPVFTRGGTPTISLSR